MANVTAYISINMLDPSVWYGSVREATSTALVLSDGVWTGIYKGVGFTYGGDHLTGGTLTGYAQYYNGQLAGEVTGISVAAQAAELYIRDNNLVGLFNIALTGNDTINGSSFIDRLVGYGGDDVLKGWGGDDALYGREGSDALYGGSGSNHLDGGAGIDYAVFDGPRIATTVLYKGGVLTANSLDGASKNTLVDIERLVFDDGVLAVDKSAAQIYRLYQAAFDRTPDKGGLSYWVQQSDSGKTLKDAASAFIQSAEFRGKFGATPNDLEFVSAIYTNVLHRTPDATGYSYWVDELAKGKDRSDVLTLFSESAENLLNTLPDTENGVWLDPVAHIWG